MNLLHLVHDRDKCIRVLKSNFREHLPIHDHLLGKESIDETTVIESMRLQGRSNTDAPESTEITLLQLAITVGVLSRHHVCLLGQAEDTSSTGTETFGTLEDTLVALFRHHTTLDSRHRKKLKSESL